MALEPRSTPGLCAALSQPTTRTWRCVGASGGRPGAPRSTVVLAADPAGVWVAYPVLAHPDDAAAIARVIDRSPALGIDGHPDDVEPVVVHCTRAGPVHRFRRVVIPANDLEWPPPDERTRLATMLDLPALEALFADYEVGFGRTSSARRRHLVDSIRRGSAIVGHRVHPCAPGGEIEGAAVSEGRTPGYEVWSHLRVAPAARRSGLAWDLGARGLFMLKAAGLGFTATVSDENPMPIPPELGWVEVQCSVDLSLPDRVPGERAVRRQLLRAEQVIDRARNARRPGRRAGTS